MRNNAFLQLRGGVASSPTRGEAGGSAAADTVDGVCLLVKRGGGS